jgi:23S rRNA pseudouridine1911/1915/1917 synthase
MISLTVSPEEIPLRLKTRLIAWGMSQAYWKKLKKAGLLFLNGSVISHDTPLQAGDLISFSFLPEAATLEPEATALTILYEDEFLLAVHKPAGLLTHSANVQPVSCLTRQVAFYYKEKHLPAGIHPVSRLDRETSGIVLFAKNACIHHLMSHTPMVKTYLGITGGKWVLKEGILDWPIGRKPGSIIERQVDEKGQPARTEYRVLQEWNNQSLVRFTLKTGRTHQIRVHCARAGHALSGDHLYGTPGPRTRHLLHACALSFVHPLTGKAIEIRDPLPEEMNRCLPFPMPDP